MTLTATSSNDVIVEQGISPVDAACANIAAELRRWFEVDFSIWDVERGVLVYAGENQPSSDSVLREALISGLRNLAAPEIIDDADYVVTLAIPINPKLNESWLALSAFPTRIVGRDEDLSEAAGLLGLDELATASWLESRVVWEPATLLKLAAAVTAKLSAESRIRQLEIEVEQVSDNLASTYEEISLLYRLTQNLRLSSTDEELGRLALDWLLECIPARGVAIQYTPEPDDRSVEYDSRVQPDLLTFGDCPVDGAEFAALVATLSSDVDQWPFVTNHSRAAKKLCRYTNIRQLILAPLCEGDNIHGWIAAFNHVNDDQFDSMEASLLNSVGTILGIHGGNQDLYRQQSNLMANVVRALTSAIDAKDPYTCGHSDRVARISVRLAEELNCDRETLKTLHMAGLLHDIGKIGIDDDVLRKDGKLTDAEFEHIKLHPSLGYKILVDLKQFSDVLPIVLHHHERWDGKGYPHGLAGTDIPYLARICAVADSFDAMTSDRPYRQGMDVEKVTAILSNGAGMQWDADIIAAYLRAKDDIIKISHRSRDSFQFDLPV